MLFLGAAPFPAFLTVSALVTPLVQLIRDIWKHRLRVKALSSPCASYSASCASHPGWRVRWALCRPLALSNRRRAMCKWGAGICACGATLALLGSLLQLRPTGAFICLGFRVALWAQCRSPAPGQQPLWLSQDPPTSPSHRGPVLSLTQAMLPLRGPDCAQPHQHVRQLYQDASGHH